MEGLSRYREMIPDFEGFMERQGEPLPTSIRINTLKVRCEDLTKRLDMSGVRYKAFCWYPLGLRLEVDRPGKMLEHALGYIHAQEEVSMIPAIVLDPQPGDKVLDLCAAPGGKAAQVAAMMENRGLIVANEPSLPRVPSLRSNLERLGVACAGVTRYDGRRFPDALFDRVMVDAPCSGEGMARKDPSVITRCNEKRSLDLQRIQKALLSRAVDLTRPGGTIVYSTCTYAPEENEAVVASVLDRARLGKVWICGLSERPGIDEWKGEDLGQEMGLTARYYPHMNDTGGFFVAKLVRA